MRYYFYSDFPCALKINGVFVAKIQNRPYLYVQQTPSLIEYFSLDSFGGTKAFFTDENFIVSPPNYVSVIDLCGGYFIYLFPPKRNNNFSVIAQKKTQNLVATLFCDNGYKLSVETPNSFYAEEFPNPIVSANFDLKRCGGNNFLILNAVNRTNYLNIYYLSDKIKKVFCSSVEDYSFDDALITEECVKDIAKHKVKRTWEFIEGEFKTAKTEIANKPNFDYFSLPNEIKAYAFFESVCLGEDITDFLTDSVKSKTDKLGGYLGKFLKVIPPPTFKNQNCVGLVYKEKENLFKVKYFRPVWAGNLIDNIIAEE